MRCFIFLFVGGRSMVGGCEIGGGGAASQDNVTRVLFVLDLILNCKTNALTLSKSEEKTLKHKHNHIFVFQ